MITGPLKQQIDKLWEEFWTGGITNPLTVIEQISFLAFARLLDMRESTEEKKWKRTNPGKPFPGALFTPKQQHMRWSSFSKEGDAAVMLKIVRDDVFPHFKTLGGKGSTFGEYMADAICMVNKPSLLVSAVNMIDRLPLGIADTKGDVYEYLLSKLTTAGINGQFRTPRHIIALMVDLVMHDLDHGEPTWTVGDPACGTGGFLVAVREYLRHAYTSAEGRIKDESTGEITYAEDKLEPYRRHVETKMLCGFDFDVTMLRISAMNLMLHGVDKPNIHYQDTLSNSFPEKHKKYAADAFDLILANPPFKGSLDQADVHSTLTSKVKTRKTELLFLVLMLRMLKIGGRCAVIVPDGVLFSSSNAHGELRRLLVEDNQLDAVINLPAGIFRPYASVSAAILIFTKGGRTGDVWFYDVRAVGKSLDDKQLDVPENDLPEVLAQWRKWNSGKGKKYFADRKSQAFFVPKGEIAGFGYDLSLNRYKVVVHEEVAHDPPKRIVARLRKLEVEIATALENLEAML